MPNNPRKALTRGLRRAMTDAESRMWYLLRDRRLLGVKFRRQVPVAGFVADFLCHECKVIIEIDGGQHAESPRDLERTRILESHGYHLIRFWNDEVLKNQASVLENICAVLLERAPSPAATRRPLPEGEANSTLPPSDVSRRGIEVKDTDDGAVA